ncbi:hypothetical protein DFA_04530 [Cavenderia fasciculata]|uniref:Uncharacterized protein n=1 Tax=Cavenderia fasciculata TaxID=261658 RepID=F4PPU6_CACFS|nr:uncharacterized protein DFA_04530 [Cavenderia fasciculata]EGG22409.1 hypothetical protein DFA_04530 [Cavenderia fasciculata]|eukprot:XP_004360260.1 hypothetical protein DFA_04530 [Cavenderia fasciculata]
MVNEIQDYIQRQSNSQSDFYFIYSVTIKCKFSTNIVMNSHFDSNHRSKAHPFGKVTSGYEKSDHATFKIEFNSHTTTPNFNVSIKVTKIEETLVEPKKITILEEHGNGDLILFHNQLNHSDHSIIDQMDIIFFFRNNNWIWKKISSSELNQSSILTSPSTTTQTKQTTFSFYDQFIQTILGNYFPIIEEYQRQSTINHNNNNDNNKIYNLI